MNQSSGNIPESNLARTLRIESKIFDRIYSNAQEVGNKDIAFITSDSNFGVIIRSISEVIAEELGGESTE